MTKSIVHAGAAFLLMLALGGCTMAPAYHRPELPVPDNYGKDITLPGHEAALPGWKAFFADPALQRLIALALDHNRDLRTAMLNIEKTRAQYRIQRADLLPTVDAAAAYEAERIPSGMSESGGAHIARAYSASLGFSAFELDLFGRVRSLTEAARETFYSAENTARTAQLSLVAEVAGVYLQLVADRELLDIARQTHANRKGQYELISNKFQSGVASQLEVSQAESSMEEARSNAVRYETQVSQDENYLTLLLGSPLPLDVPDVRNLAQVAPLPDLPAGLPSALLERRPDIQAAEHHLKAANANIGAARANFFPRISLTGAFGSISDDTADLFSSGAGTWNFVSQVSLPIFDTGRNRARLEVAQKDRDIAVAQYERSIQGAFREVADSLVQRADIGRQLDADMALLRATTTTFNLASERYDVGVDSYLNVLAAQQSLFSAQQNYLATRLLRETNALTLFKSLGGGWQE